jgi:hypothetical protein
MPYDATPLTQVQRDLFATRRLLIEEGWSNDQRQIELGNGRCILVALGRATDYDGDRFRAARSFISQEVGEGRPVTRWNDRQTSVESVLALLDRAAARAGG